jgi:cytochrome c oxidase subunit 2
MAFLFGLIVTLIALVTSYIFAAKIWWFPAPITESGGWYDSQFHLTLIICGVAFVAAQLWIAYSLIRFRGRGGRAAYIDGHGKAGKLITIGVAIVFLAIDVGTELTGERIWAAAHFDPASAQAIQVEAMAQQFAWNFRYPGPDGKFGRTKPELMKESLGNPLGLDMDDPAAKDDVVMPIIAVPVNHPVEVLLHSKDVIHSFFVRELRLKQDVVPGLDGRIHFTADKIGTYELPCAELCGLGHYQMRSFLKVMSEEDYAKWLKDNAPQAQ